MATFENYVPAVVQALGQRGIKAECPLCRKNSWVVQDLPVSIPVYEKAGMVKFPGTSMPMAALICRQCGWTGLFSLGVLGLITQKQPPAQSAEQDGKVAAAASPTTDEGSKESR